MDLNEKIVLITGGASGIGFGLAQAVVARGGFVVIADINGAQEAASALGERAEGHRLDVRKQDEWQALADDVYARLGRLDVLVNNAAVGGGGRVIGGSEAVMDWIVDVNFKAVWRGINVFGARMCEQKTPSIIAITASENSLGFVLEGLGVYAATKHALLGLADVLRHELPEQVKLCISFPGAVATGLRANSAAMTPGKPPSARMQEFGKKIDALSMGAEQAGELIAKGLERELFYIPLHPHVLDLAERRWQELQDVYARHAPPLAEIGDQHISNLIRKVMAEEDKGEDK